MTTTPPASTFARLVARSGPLGVIATFYVLGLAWLALSRGALVAFHWDRLGDVDGIWRIFAIGLRMDTIVIFQLLAVPTAIYLLLPGNVVRERIVAVLLAACAAVLVHMELSTPGFIAEFDNRPDRIYFEYLVYPREVFTTLAKTYPVSLLLVVAAVGAAAYGYWRLCRRGMRTAHPWTWTLRALAFPLVACVLLVGARSSVGHRPANLSTAAFSRNHLANELAVSSTYSLLSAIYMSRKEVDSQAMYGAMDWQEVQQRVRRGMQPPDGGFTSTRIPTLHRQVPALRPGRPPNVVVLVLESFGADFVGSLGGLPLSPNLDKWSTQGLWFTDMYATGTRTARGLEAIATGFPPTAAPSVLKLPNAQRGFFTLGQLLQSQGYATEFIYGGESNFDNMGGFFRNNGFDRIIEQRDFVDPSLLGTWGVADEDLVDKAHETFLAHGDEPFFALILSTSNHAPFEFPAGRIALYEQPAATRNNAVKYTDFAVGRFFDLARGSPYWDNTIFLVVADHDARVFGADLVPVDHFRVPALLVGPGVPKAAYTKVASQIDLAPTLLGLLGLPVEHPMIGRDLLALPDSVAGRATMQYGDANAFRVGDKVAILVPHLPARTFAYRDGRLVAADHDPELERDALAQLRWADRTYRDNLYRMRAGARGTTHPGTR
jgi:phosphoglycerol transferase MdoB-like AlkP superfamily enzyme